MDLLEAFTQAVRRAPDHPAIVHGDTVLTYGELDVLVRSVAAGLGPEPGAVAVYTAHAPGTVLGLLGVLAAGGTYVPVDPAYPADRQRAMLAAVGCRTAIVSGPVPEAAAGLRVLDLAGPLPAPGTIADTDPGVPAYILFTSGSTGAPKPVVTPRGAISAAVASIRDAVFALTPADRSLQFASLSWDTCFEEILTSLTGGSTLVFDAEAHTGSFPRLLRMLDRRRITVLNLPTAYWHELVRHLAEDEVALPASLRLVVIGGEAVSPARLADWRGLDTAGIGLRNTYGCTETTLITHAADLGGDLPGGRIPIGRALPHVIERIAPDGELLIGGPALALGYLGLPEATAARFVGGFFHTGDRVARLDGGLLVHEGRLDHEVKIRGIRVDPGEVESQLALHPGVAASAVSGVSLAGRTALVAYVVAAGSPDLSAWLRGRVPAHLVPSRITFVPALAHTASGKVDRAGTHRRYAPKENPR